VEGLTDWGKKGDVGVLVAAEAAGVSPLMIFLFPLYLNLSSGLRWGEKA
jgi:hypothetical protein